MDWRACQFESLVIIRDHQQRTVAEDFVLQAMRIGQELLPADAQQGVGIAVAVAISRLITGDEGGAGPLQCDNAGSKALLDSLREQRPRRGLLEPLGDGGDEITSGNAVESLWKTVRPNSATGPSGACIERIPA